MARPAFILQRVQRPISGDDDAAIAATTARIGFTASRKVGGAVARNRAKRRLRAVAALVMPARAVPGHDYVLVARSSVLTCAFATLAADLTTAMNELALRPGRQAHARSPKRAPRVPEQASIAP